MDKYKPENIFNCDETGLFWKLSKNKIFIENEINEINNKFRGKNHNSLCGLKG